MKTKLFLSVLALAMVAVAFMYGSSYGDQKSCCCTNCVCVSCTCAEGNCLGCGDNGCCTAGNCAMTSCDSKKGCGSSSSCDSKKGCGSSSSCDSKMTSGGALIAAACCCADCKCENCTCAENCCKDGGCKGCKDNNCCDKGNCAGGNCCKDMKTSGGVSSDSAVCVVSGEPLVKGKEVVLNYLGKDYSFCCDNCVTSFKNEPIKYIKDGLMCPVMNEPVKNSVSTVYEGTKYYFCCKMCIKDFEADANKYLKKEPKTDNK